MAEIAQHCADCHKYLGHHYKAVHQFLDFFASTSIMGDDPTSHRRLLHKEYGLKIIEKAYGPEARKAAQLHLNRDFRGMPGYEDLTKGVI